MKYANGKEVKQGDIVLGLDTSGMPVAGVVILNGHSCNSVFVSPLLIKAGTPIARVGNLMPFQDFRDSGMLNSIHLKKAERKTRNKESVWATYALALDTGKATIGVAEELVAKAQELGIKCKSFNSWRGLARTIDFELESIKEAKKRSNIPKATEKGSKWMALAIRVDNCTDEDDEEEELREQAKKMALIPSEYFSWVDLAKAIDEKLENSSAIVARVAAKKRAKKVKFVHPPDDPKLSKWMNMAIRCDSNHPVDEEAGLVVAHAESIGLDCNEFDLWVELADAIDAYHRNVSQDDGPQGNKGTDTPDGEIVEAVARVAGAVKEVAAEKRETVIKDDAYWIEVGRKADYDNDDNASVELSIEAQACGFDDTPLPSHDAVARKIIECHRDANQ